jgi:hypothetical protein
MRSLPVRGSFALPALADNQEVEALGESRHLSARADGFADDFKPYEVHLYRFGRSR